jgi:hypothetical protein
LALLRLQCLDLIQLTDEILFIIYFSNQFKCIIQNNRSIVEFKNQNFKEFPVEFNLWTPQIILDSTKNANKGCKKAQNSNIKIDTTEADTLWIIQTPSSFNKTTTTDTRNNLKSQNQTHDHTTTSALNSFVRRKISRAESVKNSRRHFKRKSKPTNTTMNNHPTTILSSYLPLKSYMVKETALSKPVRQAQQEKKIIKQAISERQGCRTAKNIIQQDSKETFDDFVIRMQKQEEKFTENHYGQRVRPYTSGGYGQLRIKHQRRPYTKSGGIRIHAHNKNYPYHQNRAYLPTQHRRKSSKGHWEYKSNGLLNDSVSKNVNNRATFYASNKDSFAKDSSVNQTYVSHKHTNMNTTYFQNW